MARPRLISDEQILRATRECVLKRGPNVSVDAIAEQLGVTGPALLKRFGNREELFIKALMPEAGLTWFRRFQDEPDARPIEAQLRAHLEAMWTFFVEMIPCITALRESGIPQQRIWDGKRDAPLQAVRLLADWLARAEAGGLIVVGAPEAVASALIGAVQHRVFLSYMVMRSEGPRAKRDFLDELTRFFGRALAPAAPPRPPRRRKLTSS